MSFKVGDKVCWESQAAGQLRRKEGEVVEVVGAYKMPKKMPKGVGMPQDEESYVVKAKAIGTMKERAKNYWPLADKLQPLVDPDDTSHTKSKESIKEQLVVINATVNGAERTVMTTMEKDENGLLQVTKEEEMFSDHPEKVEAVVMTSKEILEDLEQNDLRRPEEIAREHDICLSIEEMPGPEAEE